MNLISLTLPDDTEAWPQWLEQQLVSSELGRTVVELEVIIGTDTTKTPPLLDTILGDSMPALLESGLATLSGKQVRTLIGHPSLLLELQEQVLISDSQYWRKLLHTVSPPQEDGWLKLRKSLEQSSGIRPPGESAAVAPPTTGSQPSKLRLWASFSKFAIVAAVLIAAGLFWFRAPATKGWGLNESGLLTAEVSEPEFIVSLAEAAGKFDKPMTTNAELALRLKQFSNGCQSVIDDPLSQLSEATAANVKTACRKCQAAIEQHLATIEAGADFETVLDAAKATVGQLQSDILAAMG